MCPRRGFSSLARVGSGSVCPACILPFRYCILVESYKKGSGLQN